MYRERAKLLPTDVPTSGVAVDDTCAFLSGTYVEDADHNQYWYSPNTIKQIVLDIEQQGGRVAFLSTPSLYFSVSADCRGRSKVFDFDRKWENDPNFVFYDFNKPEDLPTDLLNTFDIAVIDPPFITQEVNAYV